MDNKQVLSNIENYVLSLFETEPTGHDFYHMKRVASMARKLARQENGNPFIAEAAGWLHDIGDKKLFDDPDLAKQDMNEFLTMQQIDREDIDAIYRAMEDVSFKSGHHIPSSLEGKIVQDADRLDALGAIGIARTFAFGGARGQMIHGEDDSLTSIRHFYDKLFKLKDLMNTKSAKSIATDRHRLMEEYIDRFYQEWNV